MAKKGALSDENRQSFPGNSLDTTRIVSSAHAPLAPGMVISEHVLP
jgi:hypothetical protein